MAGARSRDLFEGQPQLVVYHFMFDPSWSEGCKSCSCFADTFNGAAQHLGARDTAFAAISRAPFAKLDAFERAHGLELPVVLVGRQRLQLRLPRHVHARGAAAGTGEYNYVSSDFPSRRRRASSVFLRDGDEIFHTYSTYARGLDHMIGTYNLLDLTPLGRHEEGLPHPMAWIRHHDRYER